jgi:amino acid transporter
MSGSRRDNKMQGRILQGSGAVFAITLGVAAIFVWPSQATLAPFWRFIVGIAAGGFIMLLLSLILAPFVIRARKRRTQRPPGID